MKTMKFCFLMLAIFGFSVSCFCQVGENEGTVFSNSNYQIINNIGVSINVVDGWHVKKEERNAIVRFNNDDRNSYFTIQLNDFNSMLDSIWLGMGKDDIYMQKTRVFLSEINNKSKEISNSKINIYFERPFSKQIGNKELITVYKVINDKGFLIKASIDSECVNCINEFNFMTKSMQDVE